MSLPRGQLAAWRAAAPLFPEWDVRVGASTRMRLDGILPQPRHGAACALQPSLLQSPPVTTARAWLSGTLAATWRDGGVRPGWCAAALAAPAADRRDRAAAALAALRAARVGGAFWAAPVPFDREVALVCVGPGVDAVRGLAVLDRATAAHHAADMAVLADPATAPALLAAARRRGCHVLAAPHDPWSALERAGAVWLAGDHPAGLLARLTGRTIHDEAGPALRPWHAAARDPLDAAMAWLEGTRHLDPYTGQPATAEATIALLAAWRPLLAANRRVACCVGMSGWKRRRMAAFFHDGERAPPFRRSAAAAIRAARPGEAIAVWNSRVPPGLFAAAAAAGIDVLRVEDGFIRSSGLGSDFLPPSSIIADAGGIYYDPRTPSDLERLIAGTEFDPALLARARRLIDRLRRDGVTKYGAGTASGVPAGLVPPGRPVLLVPGQVADDLSVRLGAGPIRTNLALLAHVRASRPEAFVIYKPHPDVEAGHRPGAIAAAEMRRLADHVVRGGAMSALIDAADEIHTLTSLAGFEALLRGRRVLVYGQPFYAGWGLTQDAVAIARRTRRVSLEELAACVLILYPRYLDPVTSLPCGPERLIDRLATPELWRPGWLMRARQMQGRLRKRLRRGSAAAEIDVAHHD